MGGGMSAVVLVAICLAVTLKALRDKSWRERP